MEVTSATQAQSAAQQSTTGLAEDFDTFLTLLTTQLQNQDPLEPLDTNEFTSQLVQFTEVEQAIRTNEHLENLIKLQELSEGQTAVDYIGKVITAAGDEAQLIGEKASWRYDLPADAADITVKVKDESGSTVFTSEGAQTAGEHLLYWDGVGDNGQTYPPGKYSLSVEAKDAEAKPITADIFYREVVGAVDIVDGVSKLNLGEKKIAVSDVTRVETVF
ncbi:MAG: flagellar hook assembly protein FlgD [Pseudomonadota bacterium]